MLSTDVGLVLALSAVIIMPGGVVGVRSGVSAAGRTSLRVLLQSQRYKPELKQTALTRTRS